MKTVIPKFNNLLIIILANLLISLPTFSQVPEKMSYQAVIRNSNGELVVNQNVGIWLIIKQGTQFGASVLIETHVTKTDENGLLSIEIGGGNAIIGSISDIDWASGPYFLLINTDPLGDTNYNVNGLSQLLTVPYAQYAKTAENITGGISETDPVFGISAANDITESDIANWNNKPDSYTETDPVFQISAAKGIKAADTIKWNNKLEVENQNLADVLSRGNNGNGLQIKNIANPTDAQDAATKSYVDALSEEVFILKNTINAGGFVTDFDGNRYNTVKIGTQVWMAENLRTTHYADGVPLVDGTGKGSIENDYTTRYWFVYNDLLQYKNEYGLLYTWAAAMYGMNGSSANPSGVQGVCPTGWHIPGHSEWIELIDYLGGEWVAGGKLKYTGTNHWFEQGLDSTNSTFFNAQYAGVRSFYGSFWNIGNTSWYISATELPSDNMYHSRPISSGVKESPNHYGSQKNQGAPIRCVKD